MKLKLLFLTFLFSALSWGQTTVSYDFSAGGAVSGLDEAAPGIALDANIGFGSFRNSSATNPAIFSGQLRLYQNATKGGSIVIYASNGVTITEVRVFASGTTGSAAFSVDGGTSGKDRMFDALTDYKLAQNFYSLIDDQVMAIQGKGLPFEQEDRVPLGVKLPSNGIYKIAIGAVDGLFSSNQAIYLEDTALGIIHDLRQNPYSFTGTSGIINDRFVLRYTNETLGNDDFQNNSEVLISSSDVITVYSSNETIQSIQIHNVLGQLLVNQKNVNADTFEINTLQKNKAPLIIQVTLENGKKIAKKLIF